MEFPFAVPADLSTATDEELTTLLTSIREYAGTFSGQTPSTSVVEALTACRDLAREVTNVMSVRSTALSLTNEINIDTTIPEPAIAPEPVTPEPAIIPEPVDPEPVVASGTTRNPTVRDIAARRTGNTLDLPPTTGQGVSIFAAADFPGRFSTGQRIDTFEDAISALSVQVDRYPTSRQATGPVRTLETAICENGEATRFEVRSYVRHGGVQFRREFPSELVVTGNQDGFKVAQHAAKESRLPGGSLVQSYRQNVKAGRPITAAAGWCSPSQPIYDLCSLSSATAGILDLPELATDRGGWQIPANGGPNFATVWSGIGNSGTTHLTEDQVIAESPSKYCYDIPCPSFTDVRLGVDYVCLTGSLLQRRGYPEVVSWFGTQAMNALPHKINMGVIAAIVTASGAATVIPADPSGDDAISSLLSAVDLAITDSRYRNRMDPGATLEVVLPYWGLNQLRAAGSRRTSVDFVGMTDQQIVDWFSIRGAVLHLVYDWQDAFSGLGAGPGGAAALTALPLTIQFLVYPAGTWVKAVQPVVSLDTIYDSTKLVTNEYTAVFVEDGWAALQMCPLSRLYTASVDPSSCLCNYPKS